MALGGVRLKMARKNCDRINAVKTVNGYVFLNVEDNGFFSTVRKLYIDAYCMLCFSFSMQSITQYLQGGRFSETYRYI